MARRHGPQLSSLIYDKAFEADHVKRPEVADYQGQGHNRSSNRPDRFVHPTPAGISRSPCAGGERECPVVGIEDHLLGLARIGPHKRHEAVAEPHVRNFHCHCGAVKHDDLVAPIKLVGLARRKNERHIGLCKCRAARLAPLYRVTANRIVAPLITKAAQLFE
jgi:hypothetical protein